MRYEITAEEREICKLGRFMMREAPKVKDDELSNYIAQLGSRLTSWGTDYGINFSDLSEQDLTIIETFYNSLQVSDYIDQLPMEDFQD